METLEATRALGIQSRGLSHRPVTAQDGGHLSPEAPQATCSTPLVSDWPRQTHDPGLASERETQKRIGGGQSEAGLRLPHV